MKIAFILILHLGLVACAKSPQDFKDLKCQALKKLTDYMDRLRKDPTGAKLPGMLDQYAGQGVLTKVETAKYKKQIPGYAKDYRLTELVVDVKNSITSKTCNCSGLNVGLNASVGIGGLNVSAGASGSNATAEKACLTFTCSTCKAVDELLKYLRENKDDPNGAAFWRFLNKFVDKGLIKPCEYNNFRIELHSNKVEVWRDEHFKNATFTVIRFLQGKSQANCCGKVGSNATAGSATKVKCELGTYNEKTAIEQLKEFIKKNDHSSVEIMTMVNNFFVADTISGFEYDEYTNLEKGELHGKPIELAKRVLKNLLQSYAINQLNYYEDNVAHNDDKCIKLFELLKELKKIGAIDQNGYDFCKLMHSGGHEYGRPLLLVQIIKENLFAGTPNELCKRRG